MRTSQRGFTIIEIVLVLAIAGLIFLMVFVAVPTLRLRQANQQRRQDMARIMTAVQEYQAHNKGKLPFRATSDNVGDKFIDRNFITHYIDSGCQMPAQDSWYYSNLKGCGENFTDPDGTAYNIVYDGALSDNTIRRWHRDLSSDNIYDATGGDFKTHNIFVFTNAYCDDSDLWIIHGARGSQTKTREFAILFTLDGDPMICLDNK